MSDCQVFFILSSGRSGTQTLQRLFGQFPQVEMHHEYLCTHVQPLAIKYYLGRITRQAAIHELGKWHGQAVRFCRFPFWGDSSNKLSWLIEPLADLFPQAKFVHLVRDGRNVVSSFFHKLKDECYDDISWSSYRSWVENPSAETEPPPEKKYWWPHPRQMVSGWQNWSRFERLCFYWCEVNRIIEEDSRPLKEGLFHYLRLEDLVSKVESYTQLLRFLGLPIEAEPFTSLRRPHNVNIPQHFPLTSEQMAIFSRMCGATMSHYGYRMEDDYAVNYHPDGW
ncbi:MAG: sulfotransferase [Acidobacteria bacterium]|nr:sulfotransferase [Acidobacteriota bacterium]MCB9396266.1 sulfotransferase [Acidobacteriota bacterium]